MKLMIVGTLAMLALGLMAAPALAAESVSGNDKPGDGSMYADVIRYSLAYGIKDIRVEADFLQSMNPSNWSDGSGLSWDLDVNGDGEEDFIAYYSNPYNESISRVTDENHDVVCVGTVGYDSTNRRYSNTFPHSCIGSPKEVRVSVFMSWCGQNGSCYPPFDRAPDGGFSAAATRPADAVIPPGNDAGASTTGNNGDGGTTSSGPTSGHPSSNAAKPNVGSPNNSFSATGESAAQSIDSSNEPPPDPEVSSEAESTRAQDEVSAESEGLRIWYLAAALSLSLVAALTAAHIRHSRRHRTPDC